MIVISIFANKFLKEPSLTQILISINMANAKKTTLDPVALS